jgi:hypothetical protein
LLVLLERLVHAFEQPREPARAALDHHDVQLGEPLEDAGRGEVRQRALCTQPHLDVVDDRAAGAALGDRVGARADVEAHGHLVRLGRRHTGRTGRCCTASAGACIEHDRSQPARRRADLAHRLVRFLRGISAAPANRFGAAVNVSASQSLYARRRPPGSGSGITNEQRDRR